MEPIKIDYDELFHEALRARESAYAPYSGFRVGAALLCQDGSVYRGCNVENASFSATNCAERTAFFSAVCDGQRAFRAIGIVGGSGMVTDFCTPCGVCLQVMAEFCDASRFTVVLFDGTGQRKELRLADLLPNAFRLGK